MSIGTYGIAKIDATTITDENVQFLRDTDLGLIFQDGISQSEVPAKGTIATINTVVGGSGYSLAEDGLPKEGILCSATGGTGKGAQFIVQSLARGGRMVASSAVKNTAGFNNYQNDLFVAFDSENTDPYTYARIFATGQAFSGTSTALAGTSATGINGTFIVTITNGSVTGVSVSVVGSGYKVGDVVTITKTTLESGPAFGGGNVFLGDLKLLLTEENVVGGINTGSITVINGGSGYTAADTLTLQEVGSSNIGTATLDVATLGGALNTPGPIKKYPSGILNTSNTVGTIVVKDTAGNTVSLGAMQPGVIRPFGFSQVLRVGSIAAVGAITILYR
jgi:hypothetical protein|tara:strand:- start:1387 stop:2391 length:1005 start_codon:yes stop_codon:yes gene_type:complete